MSPGRIGAVAALALAITTAVTADFYLQSAIITGAILIAGIVITGTMSGRRSILAMAGASSLLLMLGPLVQGGLTAEAGMAAVSVDRLLALILLWLSASLLIWDPNRGRISNDQIDNAFAEAPTGIALISNEQLISVANAKFCELLGQSSEEVVGQSLSSLPGRLVWNALLDKSGDAANVNGEIKRGNGSKVWVAAYRKPVSDGTEQLLQLIDLTDQRNVQRALAKSEARFRNMIERSNELILILDSDLKITYANQMAARIIGDDSPLVGRALTSFTEGSSEKRLMNARRRVLEKGVADISQLDLTVNGAPVIVEARVTNQLSAPGIEGLVMMCREITYEVEAERQLHQSEARFSTIFHASPDAILILKGSDFEVLDFNERFTQLLGYTREETIGNNAVAASFWAEADVRDDIIRELNKSGEIQDREVTLLTIENEPVNVEISLTFIEIDGERSVLCLGRDITQRVRAEAALRASEDKFARVFSHSPDGICIIRASDQTLYDINDVLLQGSGFTREELLGKPLGEMDIFESSDSLDETTELLASEGSYQNKELVFVLADGNKVPCLVSSTLVELHGEAFVLSIIKNVSEQRRTEAKLFSSEQRFRGVFEDAPIGMLLVDDKGSIFSCNRFAAEMLAYKVDDMHGVHISRLVPREDRRGLKDVLQRLSEDNNVSRTERRMLSKNGLEIWTSFQLVRQQGEADQGAYYILQITDVTETKRNHARMEKMAFYDTLTNLANRRLFSDRLQHAISRTQRSKRSAALLYLDLDQFKRVNDTLGHEAGDELLRQVAARLKECVRQEDTVARPGGDEFTILLYDIHSSADAGIVAEKILTKLREPILVRGHQLVVTTSIGITVLPDDATDANTLTRNADLAMYNAKEKGRNNYQFFSENMNVNAVNRLRVENELRLALQRDEFELYYQPKVDIRTQKVIGVETLIRWNHPERGLVGPDQFIPIAEETGVVVEIGTWVIAEACRTSVALNEAAEQPISVAVNISSRQFRDPGLVNTIRRNLRLYGLAPNQLELEITETMLMHDVDAATLTLTRLHALGVQLAIDDFGTGYSSLNYLKRFPMNTVKVDRSFVKDIPNNADDMAITSAVIAMAHRLNLEVVAEGVETREQLAYLQEQKCEYAQGYLFSRPVPLDDLTALLAPSVRLLGSQASQSGNT